MKRAIFFTTTICLLGLTTSAWASETLLNILQKKGIITEEEATTIIAEQEKEKRSILPKALEGLSIGVLGYIDYSIGTKDHNGTDFNEISLTRGFVNIKKDIMPWLKARVTPDIVQITDAANSQKGDIELRMKYYYADFLTPDYGLLTDNAFRVGLAQIPWLDFEENINIYRMQGTMFQERVGNFNSTDLGVAMIGNFGGRLDRESQDEVGYPTPYAGRYGSYHIGIYNGGGYHATEENQNKVIEGRISLRPLPNFVPGLQLTYFGISGKGNDPTTPEWRNSTGYISYQNRFVVLTGEYVQAKGSQKGDNATNKSGYSVFGDFRLPVYERLALMARYDVWDPDTDSGNNKQNLLIGGISARIQGNNYLLVAYEKGHDETKTEDNKRWQVVYQLSF